MKIKNEYLLYIMDKLQPHGPINARAMFGGYGIYYNDIMFACIVENQLYFRIDEETQKNFEHYGSKPFIYNGMKKPVRMPYFTLPEEILENSNELPQWIETSYLTALKHKKPKRKKVANKQQEL